MGDAEKTALQVLVLSDCLANLAEIRRLVDASAAISKFEKKHWEVFEWKN